MSDSRLQGKRILLLAPTFFNYQNLIYEKICQLGAEAYLYDERAVTTSVEKAVLKIEPHFFKKKTKKYYQHIITEHEKRILDYVLIIKCDMPTREVMIDLKKAFPNAKFCLHLWDSIQNIPHILDKISYFDRITSFDRKDCESGYGFQFRPLFYASDFSRVVPKQNYKYDLSFCGTIHSDRYYILENIKRQCDSLGLNYYGFHYLQSEFVYKFYKLMKKEFMLTHKSDFSFKKKSSAEIIDIVSNSLAVVDIQHPKQTGLTMRTIEMLGMQKKFITTNTDIVNYDFYNSNNISVLDRKNPVLDRKFFDTPYQAASEDIYKKYCLEYWIYDVLGI